MAKSEGVGIGVLSVRSHKKEVSMTSRVAQLTWDVYVTDLTPTASDDPPPGAKQFLWQPTSATLIYGERDAVLVDALATVDQARDLADWVAAHDKNLTAVYITHGHGDHWFGLSVLLDRFPTARAFALPSVIEQMRQGSSPESLAIWNGLFPDQIPDHLVLAEPLPGDTIDLEGHELIPVEVGHSDTDASTVLSVPDIGLVVAGDAVYNDVHQYLRESGPEGRQAWLTALDTIESLQPQSVIAGHQRAGRHDGPEIIEETRQYIRDVDRAVQTTETSRELYDTLLALYPERVNPGMLWWSARALKPSS